MQKKSQDHFEFSQTTSDNPLSEVETILVIGQRISTVEAPIRYLNERVSTVVWIQWTNYWITNGPPSEIVVFQEGKQVSSRKLLSIIPPQWLVRLLNPITYLITLVTFIQATRKLGIKFDLCLGVTQFPGFVGVLLHQMGIVKKTIFLNCDYFTAKPWSLYSLVIIISNWMVKFATNYCDAAWYVTHRILDKQISVGMIKNSSILRLIVPEGISNQDIVWSENYSKTQIVFIGQVGAHQGIQLVVDSMPQVIKAVPSANFVVIGGGPYEDSLRRLVQERGLEKVINISGYATRTVVHNLLSTSAFAVAPYVPDPYSFTYYALPGKIMLYLSYGLPVIVTNVPPISEEISKKDAGIVIDYNADQLAAAIISLLNDPGKLERYRSRATALAHEYDAESIYDKAFRDTLLRFKTDLD